MELRDATRLASAGIDEVGLGGSQAVTRILGSPARLISFQFEHLDFLLTQWDSSQSLEKTDRRKRK